MFALLAITAFAADPAAPTATPVPAAPAAVTLASLDTNKDGKISATEGAANAALKAGWATADKNKDGSLDQAEFDAWMATQKPAAPATPAPAPVK
jgi:hypothetical protein